MNALALLVATAVAAADAALTNAELKNATAEWIDACAPSLTTEAGEVTCPPVDRAACDAVDARAVGDDAPREDAPPAVRVDAHLPGGLCRAVRRRRGRGSRSRGNQRGNQRGVNQ